MNVRLIATTQPCIPECCTADDLIAYCARVSSPQNQDNHATAGRLLAYCLRNKHWSVFEQASMTVEIETSRAIAQQILRHRSFCFQEFSQRYAVATSLELIELRKQGSTNRQGGEEVIDDHYARTRVDTAINTAVSVYEELVGLGVAKESARFVLPLCTQTRIYMTGTIRSWIHYLDQRLDSHAQKEHRLVAQEIETIFRATFPKVSEAIDLAEVCS